MSLLVRAATLTHFFEVAQAVGLNTQPLLRSVGLTRTLLADPEQRIPAQAAVQLLERAAEASGCPQFGLRMAESRQLSDFGAVSLLISHQPTLRAALATIVQYRHLLNDTIALQLEDAGHLVVIREEVVASALSRQATELALGVLFRLCVALMGRHWAPVGVHFSHEAPADLALHKRLFACHLEFGSEFNGIVCRAVDLDAPNPGADPAMARYAQRFLDSMPQINGPSVVLDVRKAIYLMLPSGRASSAYVAQGLGLSVRTLQRQLDMAGTSFTDVLNDIRRELAQRYAANPKYTLVRVSELLGYSTPSSFTRWFDAQFGCSPQRWRQAHHGF